MDTESHVRPEEWDNQQESFMFRRGPDAGRPAKEFLNIVTTLENLVKKKTPLSLLIVGVASGEEPISLLTVLNSLAEKQGKTLNYLVDLHMIDTRPPLLANEIDSKIMKWMIEDALQNNPLIVRSLQDSPNPQMYQVKPQVQAFLQETVDDPSHSLWKTSVEEYLHSNDHQRYDCITYNNVHGHIPESEDKDSILPGLINKLNQGGILITDGDYRDTVKKHHLYNQLKQTYGLKELFPGIFQRTIFEGQKQEHPLQRLIPNFFKRMSRNNA